MAGRNRGRGLNENLAREILELHTLGVRAGYTQDDVTSFAKVITGWTVFPAKQNADHGGEFVFGARMHEPGPQRVLGKSYLELYQEFALRLQKETKMIRRMARCMYATQCKVAAFDHFAVLEDTVRKKANVLTSMRRCGHADGLRMGRCLQRARSRRMVKMGMCTEYPA